MNICDKSALDRKEMLCFPVPFANFIKQALWATCFFEDQPGQIPLSDMRES